MAGLIPIYYLNTGSCNGCDIEILAAVNCQYKNLCFTYQVPEPAKAKIIITTGVLTASSKDNLLKIFKNKKRGCKVLAVGSCANSTGIFSGGETVLGPIDKYTKVDLYVAGCPPTPEAILEGIKKLTQSERRIKKPSIPNTFRGKIKYFPSRCIECLVCEKICPSEAIKSEKSKENFKLKFFQDRCIFCGLCQEKCPQEAIKLTKVWKLLEKERKNFTIEGVRKDLESRI